MIHTHMKYAPLNYSASKQYKIIQKYFLIIYLYNTTFVKLVKKIKLLKLNHLFTPHLNIYIDTKHIIYIYGLPLKIIFIYLF